VKVEDDGFGQCIYYGRNDMEMPILLYILHAYLSPREIRGFEPGVFIKEMIFGSVIDTELLAFDPSRHCHATLVQPSAASCRRCKLACTLKSTARPTSRFAMSRDTTRTHFRRRLNTPEHSLSSPNHREINLGNSHDTKDPMDKHLFSPESARTNVDVPLSPVDDDDASETESSADVEYGDPSGAVDEYQAAHEGARVASPEPIRRDSSFPPRSREPAAPASSAWYEFDLSVVVALISPIGNWLTGGDHVKNLLLILFLIFYLHQIIERKSPSQRSVFPSLNIIYSSMGII
jgi:hypothetical protein